ncbi:MAG TPA: hypothetical protein VNN19_11965 [bacterium]|nr:hypothetical protein [bacterium]
MRRTALTTLIVMAILIQLFAVQAPVSAQVVPPSRNSVTFSIATFNPSLYSLGFSWPVAPAWDLLLSYSWQTVAGTTGSLTGIGARYFFPLQGSTASAFLGGGFSSVALSAPGSPTVSASGLFVSGGLVAPLAQRINGYATVSLFSAGGTSNNVIDLGAQFRLAPQISAQVGYVSFSGASAPYVGVTVHLR